MYCSTRQLLVEVGIEGVAQAIADERKGQHRDGDHQGWEQPQMPVDPNIGVGFRDHLPPAWQRIVDTQAQEAQTGLGEDRAWHTQRHRDDQRRERIGQQMARGDPPGTSTPSACAAVTNSFSRNDNNWARVRRQISTHPIKPIASTTLNRLS